MYHVPAADYNHLVGALAVNITETSQSKAEREIALLRQLKLKQVNSNLGLISLRM